MNNILQINEVNIQSDELFDNDPEVMFNCNFIIPDGRQVYQYQNEIYLFNGQYFEKYNPVMNLFHEDKIKRIKDIVDKKQWGMIEGVMVDVFTASAIITVYDRINLKNKLKLLSKDIKSIIDIVFKTLEK